MALSDLLNTSFTGLPRTSPGADDARLAGPGIPARSSSVFTAMPDLIGAASGEGTAAQPAPPQPQPPPGVAMPFPAAPMPPPGIPAVMATLDPNLIDRLGPIVFRPQAPQPHVATDLARRAIDQLRSVGDGPVNDAIAAAHNASVPAANLMAFLARKVLIGEVLGGAAATWSDETRSDFAEALNIGVDRQDVMNAVVSLAVLNDPDLEQEMRGEHLVQPTEADLLGSRPVVWQHPPAGTPLQPPYVILVAVEHQPMAEAQEAVDAILAELVDRNGFRVPRSRLRPQDVVGPAVLADRPLLADRLARRPIQ